MGKTFKDSAYRSIRKPLPRQGQRFESRRQDLRDDAAWREIEKEIETARFNSGYDHDFEE